VRVIAVERDGKRTLATENTVIGAGDLVTLFSLQRVPDELIDKLVA
jgi:Trk K+ transport system NAD-binding subunit